jgi:anthranilate phosphoribosyltransferase
MNRWLDRLTQGDSLSEHEAEELFGLLIDSATHPALVGAILAALRTKGETPAEVRGLARAMRRCAVSPELGDHSQLLDVVGTGGDGSSSFNLSTGSALLAAACGVRVAKHGNNAISSRAGSADLLAALGLSLPLDPDAARATLDRSGFTFLHAPRYHPVLKTIAPVRRALSTRTVFNILGPLCHPAEAPYAVIGAYDLTTARLMAEALAGLPIRRAFVIHAENGWDEPTPIAPFQLFDVRPGSLAASQRCAEQYGLASCRAEQLVGGDAAHNAAALRRVAAGEQGPHRDALVLGAALGLEVIGAARDPSAAAWRATQALDDGSLQRLLERIAA